MNDLDKKLVVQICSLTSRGFTSEGQLGQGEQGAVVKAKHWLDQGHYAIKFLPLMQHENLSEQQRLELSILSNPKLSRKNIVRYHTSWTYSNLGISFLCMQIELCDASLYGFAFENELSGTQMISEDPLRFYGHCFVGILNGLVAIHELGWMHRDIHAKNILIAQPGYRVKISDFGRAREISSVTPGNLEMFVPCLGQAPEMSAPGVYDQKVDIFGAGSVLKLIGRRYIQRLRTYRQMSEQERRTQVILGMVKSMINVDPNSRLAAREYLQRLNSENT